jgi:hypothetical protein
MRRVALLLIFAFHAVAAPLEPMDVKVKLRGYFLAASGEKDTKALGGFAPSANLPKRLDQVVPQRALSLIAAPDEVAEFRGKKGFRVMLANTSRKTASFEASDSRLNIVREALDRQGQWRAVEYLPQSWCGNSYHRLFLPSGRYWSFVAPEFRGTFRTKMRFVLQQEGLTLRSNEFSGTVNPEQFEKLEGHQATSIMDPYDQ